MSAFPRQPKIINKKSLSNVQLHQLGTNFWFKNRGVSPKNRSHSTPNKQTNKIWKVFLGWRIQTNKQPKILKHQKKIIKKLISHKKKYYGYYGMFFYIFLRGDFHKISWQKLMKKQWSFPTSKKPKKTFTNDQPSWMPSGCLRSLGRSNRALLDLFDDGC